MVVGHFFLRNFAVNEKACLKNSMHGKSNADCCSVVCSFFSGIQNPVHVLHARERQIIGGLLQECLGTVFVTEKDKLLHFVYFALHGNPSLSVMFVHNNLYSHLSL